MISDRPDRPDLLDDETLATDLAVLGDDAGDEPKVGRPAAAEGGSKAGPARADGTDADPSRGERTERKAD